MAAMLPNMNPDDQILRRRQWVSINDPTMAAPPNGNGWPAEVHVTSEGNLHNENGPAAVYPDGRRYYFLHGVQVEKKIIDGKITKEDIVEARSQEVRRVLIDKVGPRKFRRMFKPKTLSKDEYGELVQLNIEELESNGMLMVNNLRLASTTSTRLYHPLTGSEVVESWLPEQPEPEPYIAVHVTDPSTEREYYLRVPPEFKNRSPREAVAWTFGEDRTSYKPSVET